MPPVQLGVKGRKRRFGGLYSTALAKGSVWSQDMLIEFMVKGISCSRLDWARESENGAAAGAWSRQTGPAEVGAALVSRPEKGPKVHFTL